MNSTPLKASQHQNGNHETPSGARNQKTDAIITVVASTKPASERNHGRRITARL
ncbi:hypothetical protein D3C83_168240 [compost metagenome]